MEIKFNSLINFLYKNSVNVKTNIDLNDSFVGINSLNNCKKNYLTFFHNEKYSYLLEKTQAKACFIKEKHKDLLPSSCMPIFVNDPYLAFAFTTNFLFPKKISNGIVSKNANIDTKSILGSNIQINDFASINNTEIGDNSIILENVVLGPNVILGSNSIIMPNCVISDSILGDNVVIQSGTVIGGKGFGFELKSKVEVRHVGKVVIGNNVDVGSNCTIDRATIDSTIIDDNVRIDNLVQIAHNVKIGNNTIIAAQTGIAGSTSIGKECVIGGQVGVGGHLKIGDKVTIAAKSGVTKNIKDNSVIAGFPAIDIKKWKKNIIHQYKNIK